MKVPADLVPGLYTAVLIPSSHGLSSVHAVYKGVNHQKPPLQPHPNRVTPQVPCLQTPSHWARVSVGEFGVQAGSKHIAKIKHTAKKVVFFIKLSVFWVYNEGLFYCLTEKRKSVVDWYFSPGRRMGVGQSNLLGESGNFCVSKQTALR